MLKRSNPLSIKSFIKRFLKIINLKIIHKGLMSFREYWYLAKEIELLSPSNILVFGLGFDSILWNDLNKDGKTIFIEDNKDWIEKFKNKNLSIKKVSYKTEINKFQEYGFNNEILLLKLNKKIFETKWDIIIIDGPLGHQPPREWAGPGRMSSLYTAKHLSKYAKYIVVDDFSREIERTFSYKYFGKENLYKLINNKLAFFKINKN